MTPADVPCRSCNAPVGEQCSTKAEANSVYVRMLTYFHSVRWRDFNRHAVELAAMDDWKNKYGGKSA
jgi:hypothetical protein